jgi:hypothetical protein
MDRWILRPLFITLCGIVKAFGVAKSTASAIRSGKRVPAVRHWEVLEALKDQVETHRLLGTPR